MEKRALLVGMEVDVITLENSMEIPQKKKKERELLCDPAVPLLDTYPKERNYFLEDISALLSSLRLYLQWSRYGSNFSIHQWTNKIDR